MILEAILGIGIVYVIGKALGFDIKVEKKETRGRPRKQDNVDAETLAKRKRAREYMNEYRKRKESA